MTKLYGLPLLGHEGSKSIHAGTTTQNSAVHI